MDNITKAKNKIRTELSGYCSNEARRLTAMAGIPQQQINNENYLFVRNSMYYNLPKDQITRAVFDLTSLLQVAGIVGYLEDF